MITHSPIINHQITKQIILKGNGEGDFDNATHTDVVGLWESECSGYPKSDGTCDELSFNGDNNGDKVYFVGLDNTHWTTWSLTGNWNYIDESE